MQEEGFFYFLVAEELSPIVNCWLIKPAQSIFFKDLNAL